MKETDERPSSCTGPGENRAARERYAAWTADTISGTYPRAGVLARGAGLHCDPRTLKNYTTTPAQLCTLPATAAKNKKRENSN